MAGLHVQSHEQDEEEFDADSWLFDSIKSYNHLHMYELQSVPTALGFISKNALCVSCKQENGSTEILELALPDKLLSENESLSKERDFRVLSGGFHDRVVTSILSIPNTRNIVTNEEGSNCLNIWKLGNDSTDICKHEGTIKAQITDKNSCCACILENGSAKVVFGSKINNICVADLSTQQIICALESKQKEDISKLGCVDEFTFAMFSRQDGSVWIVDSRQAPSTSMTLAFPKDSRSPDLIGSNWSCDMQPPGDTSINFVSVNEHGQGDIGDLRNTKKTSRFSLNLPKKRKSNTCDIHISPWSKLITASGIDGNVYLYDLTKQAGDGPVPAVFCHRGHSACSQTPEDTVTIATAWYPWQQDLLFSTANDGSLNAWSFVL